MAVFLRIRIVTFFLMWVWVIAKCKASTQSKDQPFLSLKVFLTSHLDLAFSHSVRVLIRTLTACKCSKPVLPIKIEESLWDLGGLCFIFGCDCQWPLKWGQFSMMYLSSRMTNVASRADKSCHNLYSVSTCWSWLWPLNFVISFFPFH